MDLNLLCGACRQPCFLIGTACDVRLCNCRTEWTAAAAEDDGRVLDFSLGPLRWRVRTRFGEGMDLTVAALLVLNDALRLGTCEQRTVRVPRPCARPPGANVRAQPFAAGLPGWSARAWTYLQDAKHWRSETRRVRARRKDAGLLSVTLTPTVPEPAPDVAATSIKRARTAARGLRDVQRDIFEMVSPLVLHFCQTQCVL